MRFFRTALSLIIVAVLIAAGVPVSAGAEAIDSVAVSTHVPYTTYMYNYNGNPITTPHAYIPDAVYSGEQLGVGAFTTPEDIEVDKNGNLYVVDSEYIPAAVPGNTETSTSPTDTAGTPSEETGSSAAETETTETPAETTAADNTAAGTSTDVQATDTEASDPADTGNGTESNGEDTGESSEGEDTAEKADVIDESSLPEYLRSDISADTAKELDALIEMLPPAESITVDYGRRIAAISEAYRGLNQKEKEQVKNRDVLDTLSDYVLLTTDVNANTGAALDKYIDLLPEVENITVQHEKRISQLISAYNKLSAGEKSAAKLFAELDAADKKMYYSSEIDARTADTLDKYISLLPQVQNITEDYEGRIQALIIAYRGLTDEEKILVKNKAILDASEYKLDEFQCAKRYAARKGRLVVFNRDFTVKFIIESFDNDGHIDGFNMPEGITVALDGTLYLADTHNKRIIQFTADGQFIRDIKDPQIVMLGSDYVYRPTKLSIDTSGNIFVVALNANMGIILLDSNGDFSGFVGAQKVSYNPIDYIWKNILTEEQQNRMESFVPTEYNNIIMDTEGFVYVTTSAIKSDDLASAIMSHSKSTVTAPVKRLNPTGNDVLKRWGYYAPAGDVSFYYDSVGNPTTSIIADVALSPSNRYTILDTRNNRLFTYSNSGELLYAFASEGYEAGNTVMPTSITYDGDDLLVLDSRTGYITRYVLTEYGRLIDQAYSYYYNYEYDKSVEVWQKVLSANANFDIAYDGIANSYLRTGQYKEAMEYFRFSNNKSSYSNAFSKYRTDVIENYLLVVVLVAVILIFAVFRMFKYFGKRNKNPKYIDKRGGLFNQLCYAVYVIIHPFDGFWDLKHEKRGGMRAANIILASLVLVRIAEKFFTNYLFNNNYGSKISVITEVVMVLFPFLLWVMSNWSVTTLVDGEGKMKDVYIFTAYALTPLLILTFLKIVLSHFIILDESMYLTLIGSIGFYWTGFLIFSGNTVTHRYTVSKSVGSIIFAAVGIAIMVFVLLVIVSTYQSMYSFVANLIKEVTYRM